MNVIEIIFSPTGGTEKAAHVIGKRWGDDPQIIDLSNPKTEFSKCKISAEDIVIIAMPSFGGRAPAIAIDRLKQITGNGARCILVCVYGNRAYEDTLIEMEDAAVKCGFCVIAAVAAIAEHSILPQYAAGRPDASDEKQLTDFADSIAAKPNNSISVPGNRPYKKGGSLGLVPKPNKHCTKCGVCTEKCPVQAIKPSEFIADTKKCISCMRCVKQCPSNARKLNGAVVNAAALALKKACSQRKENELFI